MHQVPADKASVARKYRIWAVLLSIGGAVSAVIAGAVAFRWLYGHAFRLGGTLVVGPRFSHGVTAWGDGVGIRAEDSTYDGESLVFSYPGTGSRMHVWPLREERKASQKGAYWMPIGIGVIGEARYHIEIYYWHGFTIFQINHRAVPWM